MKIELNNSEIANYSADLAYDVSRFRIGDSDVTKKRTSAMLSFSNAFLKITIFTKIK